jgi:lipopolysaccharide biosynthesis glycosyltransferase
METGHGVGVKLEVITSFDQTYYDKIGHACVNTWLHHWPADLTLTCYVEDFRLPEQARLNQIDFAELSDGYRVLQQSDRFKDRVKTFAKKAYSVIHAMEHSTADRIIWIDADVLTVADIPRKFLESLCPDNTLATYMQVYHEKEDRVWTSAETGIFVLNTQHSEFKAFARRYTQYYDEHLTENIRRFYDGEVFGAVANEFKPHVRDLCSDFVKKYKTPLRHTILGPYLNHYKSKGNKESFTI